MSNLYKKAKTKLKEAIFSYGHDKNPIQVSRISSEWEPFGAIEGDMAKQIEIVNGAYTIVYKTPKGKFVRHFHENVESGIVIKGTIKVVEPEREYIIKEGESYTIQKGVWHEVEFLEDKNCLFLQFHPEFKSGNWEATIN